MTPYQKNPSLKLQKHVLIIFSALIFISLILSAQKQAGDLTINSKPCCLKGYICKAVMNIKR